MCKKRVHWHFQKLQTHVSPLDCTPFFHDDEESSCMERREMSEPTSAINSTFITCAKLWRQLHANVIYRTLRHLFQEGPNQHLCATVYLSTSGVLVRAHSRAIAGYAHLILISCLGMIVHDAPAREHGGKAEENRCCRSHASQLATTQKARARS